MHLSLLAALLLGAAPPDKSDAGPFVRALWLVQRYGKPEAIDPAADPRTKGILAKALGKDGSLTFSKIEALMQPDRFQALAGSDERLDAIELGRAVDAAIPASRTHLLPAVCEHADYLTKSFDMIDAVHREAGGQLADWLVKQYRPGQPLHVVVVCTGNSRRSILGSTMGNLAADYYGLPEIRFHSGGTAPTAFNTRTIATLKAIGFEVDPTGQEAKRGEPQTANPTYRIRWGDTAACEATEFSKVYSDASNPQTGFAALMVCSEADAGCPFVKGAALRLSMPYLDPKIYDASPYESARYAERRDDIGRLMLSVMMQVRRRAAATESVAKGAR